MSKHSGLGSPNDDAISISLWREEKSMFSLKKKMPREKCLWNRKNVSSSSKMRSRLESLLFRRAKCIADREHRSLQWIVALPENCSGLKQILLLAFESKLKPPAAAAAPKSCPNDHQRSSMTIFNVRIVARSKRSAWIYSTVKEEAQTLT